MRRALPMGSYSWDGVVRDAKVHPRGRVEGKGVGYAEALRDENSCCAD